MTRLLQLAAALLLTSTLAHAQTQPPPPQTEIKPGKKQKAVPENVEWLWQYTPTDTDKQGRENDLVQDLHFRPFLEIGWPDRVDNDSTPTGEPVP